MSAEMKSKLAAIRVSLDAALAAIAKEHGLRDLHAGNCTFSREGSFTFKVEGIASGGASKDEQYYNQLRSMQWLSKGLLPELGAKVEYGGEQVVMTGANSTASKVFYKRPNGKTYQTRTEAFVAYLERMPGNAAKAANIIDKAFKGAKVSAP